MGYTPPYLDVRKVAGAYDVYAPSSTSLDDLILHPNTTNAYSKLTLFGNGGIYAYLTNGISFTFLNENTAFLAISYDGTDAKIVGSVADKNLFLSPSGTGLVKFGAYTAGAATDSTGYITILDAAGNTRKLMVQA